VPSTSRSKCWWAATQFERRRGSGGGKGTGSSQEFGSAIGVTGAAVDERLTTVTASQRLSEGGKRAREQRNFIDAAAAATILEHALAYEQSREEPPGELVSAPGGPVTNGPDLPGGSGQERPLQT
jgi:hypothetical protein